MKILIVDDRPTNLKLLRFLLEGEGHDVRESQDGRDALALLNQEVVDAIISDVLMPNMDGFRLCLEVRKHPRFQAIPFIVYTSTYSSSGDRQLALNAGADCYLVKPAPDAVILSTLAEAVQKAGSRIRFVATTEIEVDVIKQYNAALVSKLEERNIELEASNTSLRASEERFRQLAENIHEVFWMTDPEKAVMLYVSPGYEKIWGRTCDSLYADPSTWMQAIYPEDRARINAATKAKQLEGEYDETYRIVRPDDSVRWIRDRAFPVHDNHGNVYRMVGTAVDITEQRLLEEQFHQAQKMEAIGTLAGGIAHDFNNILSVIVGYTDLVKISAGDNDDVRDGLDAIGKAATRATALVRQILTFSRQEDPERKTISLVPVIEEAMKFLRATLPSTLECHTVVAKNVPIVLADATQVHQIVMNLGTNAWHAMKDGSGCLEVALDDFNVVPEMKIAHPPLKSGRYARLTVKDTGKGMTPETLARIFEPFFTTKPVGQGTGLGLAVVHGIMRSHGGVITVESEVGRGTSFYLYFPAASEVALAPVIEPTVALRGFGERILFVDDEQALARLGQKILERLGYVVESYTEVVRALARVRADPHYFDVVVSDMTMPEMTGLQFAQQLALVRPELPVIITSGYAGQLTEEKIRAVNIRALLVKPPTMLSLGSLLRRVLAVDGRMRTDDQLN